MDRPYVIGTGLLLSGNEKFAMHVFRCFINRKIGIIFSDDLDKLLIV